MSRTRASSAKAGPRKGGRLAPSRLLGSLWKRGATEAALLVTAAAVASGVVFGAGVARATSQTSDGQTWVSASDGTIVEINPVTGQPVTRIAIPLAGQVTVQQGGGVVLVTSPASGKAVSIDVGQVTASRSRDVDPSTRKPLLAPGGRMLIAELDTGVIRVVDSATMVDTGEAFVGPGPFVDVVVDKTAEVWALGTDGTLTSVHFSDDANRFITDGSKSLEGIDDNSRMVPHPRGVTVLSPSRKALMQVGTGADVQTIVDGMDGDILPAESSPRDLVAATLVDRQAVMILDGDRVWKADLSAAGCKEPGRPAVFGDRIYVPCAGQGRTLVLDRTGQPAREAIVTGSDDTPQIIADDDSLVVTSPTAGTTVTVDAQGRQHRSEIRSPSIPVVKPKRPDPNKAGGSVSASQTPTPTPTPPPDQPTSDTPTSESDLLTSQPEQPEPPVGPNPPQESNSTTSVPSTTVVSTGTSINPSQPTGNAPDGARNVTAVAQQELGVALVSWTPPAERPERYTVQATDGAGATSVPGGADSVTITLPGRASASFVVISYFGDGRTSASQASSVVVWSDSSSETSTSTSTRTSTSTTRTTPTTTRTSPTGPAPECNRPQPNAQPNAGTRPPSTCLTTTTSSSDPSGEPSIPTTTPTSGTRPSEPSVPTTPTSVTPTVPTTPTTPTVPTTPTTPTTSEVPTTPPTSEAPTTPPTSEAPTTPPTSEVPTTPPTSEPPAPTPPSAPANFSAYGDSSDGSNSIWANWTATAGVSYVLTFTRGSVVQGPYTVTAESYQQTYGPRMLGSVTVSIYATQNGLNSETITATADLQGYDQCNPLRAGASWIHGLPMQNCCPQQSQPYQCVQPLRDDTTWLQADTVTPVPTSGSGSAVRIALAVTLLVLAAGVHLARIRSRRRSAAGSSAPHGSIA